MPATLTRWNPLAELADIGARFDRLLDDIGDGRGHTWTPAIDLVRDDGHLVVRAVIPGMTPEEISIEVDNGVLTLSGKHEEREEKTEKHYVRRERRYGAFTRRMALPDGVDAKKIKATTHDGVLEVTIPLPQEQAREAVSITPTAA